MIIYFDSLTGNTKRFVEKVKKERPDWTIQKISSNLQINQKGHLITYTIGIGNIPISTTQFVKKNKDFLLSVSSTGNRNWGDNFGLAADKLSKHYNLPIAFKLELSGTNADVKSYIEILEKLGE
ncbi:class Ib ribonucleoside-diphosphate reductase assembly flavoprotein NrdI [Rhizosphaericola mali]|uniref:Class Ib ribonucleoside-diphosphate reductase assembly flavoprotein NrdI n=1 Tax=Rhizosphaericola mali TaxID=2545455 RepID=A0A5P2G8T9_9BACT|nr:class Ib ribonucleoside-diphosphate reductase assembly flavoprotein NrdI [Rhizosphaericola mali]QES87941.1 class Ib ribonucleoside-diphosphate reductase assembly flavoprotein NrdI [Rhizosphaericola mali]